MRDIGIDKYVAIAVAVESSGYSHFLMPAVLSANRVGLHRKDQILMNTCIFPMNPRRIRIAAGKRANAVDLAHLPLPRLDLLQIHQCGRPSLAATVFLQPPASQMVRACHHAWTDSLSDPHAIYKIANSGCQADQVAGADFESISIQRMQPDRVLVGNLI